MQSWQLGLWMCASAHLCCYNRTADTLGRNKYSTLKFCLLGGLRTRFCHLLPLLSCVITSILVVQRSSFNPFRKEMPSTHPRHNFGPVCQTKATNFRNLTSAQLFLFWSTLAVIAQQDMGSGLVFLFSFFFVCLFGAFVGSLSLDVCNILGWWFYGCKCKTVACRCGTILCTARLRMPDKGSRRLRHGEVELSTLLVRGAPCSSSTTKPSCIWGGEVSPPPISPSSWYCHNGHWIPTWPLMDMFRS